VDLEVEEFLTKEMEQVTKEDILHQKVIQVDRTKVAHAVAVAAVVPVKPVDLRQVHQELQEEMEQHLQSQVLQ
jgi:hypothetical protein